MKLKTNNILGVLGALVIAVSTMFMSGYNVSACGCGCPACTGADVQSSGNNVVIGDNNKIYGDIIVGDNSVQTIPAFTCTLEVVELAIDVHVKDKLEVNGMETTYGFVLGEDNKENCYKATLPESEYNKYFDSEKETMPVTVYRLTILEKSYSREVLKRYRSPRAPQDMTCIGSETIVLENSSSRGVFERYSFPWEPQDRTFTEAEMTELKNLIESGVSYEIEDIKSKYGVNYCKIDDNEAGMQLYEQWMTGIYVLSYVFVFLVMFVVLLVIVVPVYLAA